MKKFFSIFAILSLAFSFGCGGGAEKPADEEKPAEEKPAEEKPAEEKPAE